jgi:hypothetical protein
MRFFTPEWCRGDDDLDAAAAYVAALEQLGADLPVAARVLARSISLHDARIRRIDADARRCELALLLRAGDHERGYFDLDLHYGGFAMAAPDAARLRVVGADPTAELLYDEVDAVDGGFEHRLLFSREREVAIRFADLGLRLASRPSRAFERGVDRFEGC